MKKKILLFIALIALLGGGVYFRFYSKNTLLTNVPTLADKMLVLDRKAFELEVVSRGLSEWIKNPSFSTKNLLKNTKPEFQPGDFITAFHIPAKGWFFKINISDSARFENFLLEKKAEKRSDYWVKNNLQIYLFDKSLVACFPEKNTDFQAERESISGIFSQTKSLDLQDFKSLNLLTFLDLNQNKNVLGLDLNKNRIEVNGYWNFKAISDDRVKVFKNNGLLDFGINAILAQEIFPKLFQEKNSLGISTLSGSIRELEVKKDSVLTYEFDEDFNEISINKVQIRLEPVYQISFFSKDIDALEKQFLENKWIDERLQFVKIPFLPNAVSKTNGQLNVLSKGLNESVLETSEFLGFLHYSDGFLNKSSLDQLTSLTEKERKLAGDLEEIRMEIRADSKTSLQVNGFVNMRTDPVQSLLSIWH